jgi:hypothetical protein
MDPLTAGLVGEYVLLEQVWAWVRHGLAIVGWAIVLALAAAGNCWCCGYPVRAEFFRRRPQPQQPQPQQPHRPQHRECPVALTIPDDGAIAGEAARGIREIERYLSRV